MVGSRTRPRPWREPRQAGYSFVMTTDPSLSNADPADVAEQLQDAFPTATDEDAGVGPNGIPMEANEADVSEQRIEVPSDVDDDVDGT
jgi:hypothetical protein